MPFTPTTAQLELLAELEMAQMPVALIADRLGIDVATFESWTARLDAAGRDFVEAPETVAEDFSQAVSTSRATLSKERAAYRRRSDIR